MRPGTKPRRTQRERREQTRRRVLEATIASLLDAGYHATTTRRVAELAGVSLGAMTHQFPRRADLLGAALEHMTEARIADLRVRAASLPGEPHVRLGALLDLLWEDFSGDAYRVFVKLWTAADDDPELYARLVPLERQLRREVRESARVLGGPLIDEPGWEARLAVILSALRGLALSHHFEPRAGAPRPGWPAARAALLEALAP